ACTRRHVRKLGPITSTVVGSTVILRQQHQPSRRIYSARTAERAVAGLLEVDVGVDARGRTYDPVAATREALAGAQAIRDADVVGRVAEDR
ncbi:MAG TPA: hypothetical protein VN778_04225, partial [Verrucomicrobiae bacterium]|nr:hypothetical protein [Verrucomicrobiae bacterium]